MNIDKFISIIFHPVFMPSLTVLLITKEYLNIIVLAPQVPIIIIGTIIFSLALPLLSVFFLIISLKNVISNNENQTFFINIFTYFPFNFVCV